MRANLKQRLEQSHSGIDLSPLLDVVFILLIFFIVTSVFVKETGVVFQLGHQHRQTESHFRAREAINKGLASKAIIVCGTGIGISIAANKVPGIRAALCHNVEYAKLARQHNNANVLALGGRFLKAQEAKNIVDTWLNTEFEGGRHQKRINKINEYERNYNETH